MTIKLIDDLTKPEGALMFEPDVTMENAIKFSRFDNDNLLATTENYPIELEGRQWKSAEHYYQHGIAGNKLTCDKIDASEHARDAYAINKPWYRYKRKGWKNLRRTLMTRALYIKVQMYPEVREYLLGTGDEKIIETSAYDHYWGIGRDQRGDNMLGQVWMDIRNKLRETEKQSSDDE